MKRKVIQLAGKTLVVSLPSKWAERYGIKKGEEVEVVDIGPYIKIFKESGTGSDEKKRVTIDLRNANRAATRAILSGFYKQGYDEITVMYNSKEVYDAIQEKRRDAWPGFTVHETGDDRLIVSSFANDSPTEFNASLRRAFLVTISMGEKLLDAIKRRDYKNLEEIKQMEGLNNQLTSFCERLINKGFVDKDKASFYYVLCWNLEKVCDPYRDIICLINENEKTKISPDIVDLFGITNIILKKYYEAVFDYNIKKAISLTSEKCEILKEVGKICKNKSEFECKVINHLYEIAALASNFSGPVNVLNNEKLRIHSSNN